MQVSTSHTKISTLTSNTTVFHAIKIIIVSTISRPTVDVLQIFNAHINMYTFLYIFLDEIYRYIFLYEIYRYRFLYEIYRYIFLYEIYRYIFLYINMKYCLLACCKEIYLTFEG